MARCKACGTEAPAMARFCNICGAAVTAASAPPASAATSMPAARPQPTQYAPPTAAAPPQNQSTGMNKAAIAALVSGVVLIGAAGFLFAKSAGLLNAQKPSSPSGAVINAPNTQPAQAPVLSAPQPQMPQAPIMKPPGTIGNPMPEDVIAYLRWLKWYDGELQKLMAKLESIGINAVPTLYLSAMDQIQSDDSEQKGNNAQNLKDQMNQIASDMNQAAAIFSQKNPPDACANLATTYREGMNESVRQSAALTQLIIKIIDSFADMSNGDQQRKADLPGLMKEMQGGGLSNRADLTRNSASQSLNTLRDRYTDIPPDISASNFQIKTLDSGFDPTKLMKGMGGAGF